MTQYFVAASLAVTIASSLFEFGVTSMAHLFFFFFGSVSHSSFFIGAWPFSDLSRCSVEFKYGL